MKVNQYIKVSEIYYHLMNKIEYDDWAKYLVEISSRYKIKTNYVLDLGAGNGTLSSLLTKRFNGIILTDLSLQMLVKNNDLNFKMLKVCCNMTSLPFSSQFDFIFSTFDSINYLTKIDKLYLLFNEINRVLSTEGIFTFDVSLEKNSTKNFKYLNRDGNYNGIYYSQKSEYNKKTRIHRNYFTIIFPDGNNYEEVHEQKIYYFEEYFEVINDCGLYVQECFDAFTFNDANPKQERVQFIVKKRV
jgi:SAM-dependent methyltransferase